MNADKMIRFNLNGKNVTIPPETDNVMMVDVLRDIFGLTGTKKGCGTGDCGACMILLDGKAVKSCLLPASKVQGRHLQTIEGIGSPQSLHPLQEAFIRNGAVQCGFCTPGMIISAKALLDRNPKPSESQIRRAISNNLCRCTGYKKIVEAIQDASLRLARGVSYDKKVSPPERTHYIGIRQENLLAREKVLGRARFGADYYMPDMAYIKVFRSKYAHALISNIDTSAAEKIPGVLGVATYKDIPGSNYVFLLKGLKDQPIFAEEKVRYKGEAIAAVAATSLRIAEKALETIHVDYKPIEPIWNVYDALAGDAPQIHQQGNLICSDKLLKGNVKQGFEEADAVVKAQFSIPIVEHAYLEPEAGIAYIGPKGRLILKSGCQDAHLIRRGLSIILGMDEKKIRVIQTATGGGFGGKVDLTIQGILGLMALKLKKPVKLVLEREESFNSTPKRHAYEITGRLGARKDGTFTAISFDVLADGGAYTSWSPSVLKKSAIHSSGPYYIPNVLFEGKMVYTNNTFCGAHRAFGVGQIEFALESLIDIMAEKLDLDPMDIRMTNALDKGLTTASSQTLSASIGIKETIKSLYGIYQKEKDNQSVYLNNGDVREGLGLACVSYGIGYTGVSNPSEAECEILKSGKIRVYIGTCDIGQGSDTVMAQIAAEEMRLPVERIEIISADTDRTPDARLTVASRQTYTTGKAVQIAAKNLSKAVRDAASIFLGAPEDNIEFKEGDFFSKNNPFKKFDLRHLYDICREQGSYKQHGFFDPEASGFALDNNNQGNAYPSYCFGTQLVKIKVDLRKGKVTVSKVWAAHDLGKAININSVEGQIEGSIVMGLGHALMEKFDSMKTTSFKQYTIPKVKDMPDICPIIIEEEEPTGPFGAKGVGEAAMIPIVPAIANAIYNAVGIRMRKLPILSKDIILALEEIKN